MRIGDLDPDPLVQLRAWLAEAERVEARPDAMTLATATPDGRPSARIVLLRGLDERGLVFFTNRRSRKGDELRANARAALVFHWPALGRQARVEGTAEPVPDAESEAYWRTRPRESRLAAWASPQSQVLAGRAELERRFAEAERAFAGSDVPLPSFWGGYRVVPETVELWLHRESRLHDRVRYRREDGGWVRERLAP
ncbi:MAG TPA: pyridoxamine 5'-phosphate oxidase [Gaiellaceae bacterium]|nr:pyridoxamine 5'-phosphate oxidase [Gaiellaceae bacterium]